MNVDVANVMEEVANYSAKNKLYSKEFVLSRLVTVTKEDTKGAVGHLSYAIICYQKSHTNFHVYNLQKKNIYS